MIVDALLAVGRFIDRLLGNDRPARSSLDAWRIPLQGGAVDEPWYGDAIDPPETVVSPLSAHEAAELLDFDIERSSPRR